MRSALHNGDDAGRIIEELKNVIPDGYGLTVEENGDIGGASIEAILEEVIGTFTGEIGPISAFFMLAFGLAVLVGASRYLLASRDDLLGKTAQVGVCTVASVSLFSPLYAICITVRDSLITIIDFISSIIPVMTLVSCAEGAGESAATQAFGLNFTLMLLDKLAVKLLLPVSFSMFTLSFVSSFASGGISSVIKGMKNLYTWGIGIISAVLSAVLAMQGVVASARDTALLRAARYAAGSMIPVVGNTVASALSTLGGGLALVKSSVGVSSVVVILITVLTPLLYLIAHRLALSVAILFLEFAESEGGVRCFSAFRSALDALLAVYSMSILVCIVEMVVFIKSGGGLV